MGGRRGFADYTRRGGPCCWRLRLRSLDSLPLPLISPCRPAVTEGSATAAVCCCRHLCLLPSTQMSGLSFLPLSFQLLLLPCSLRSHHVGVQTPGRCSGCFLACPGLRQPTLPHPYLGSWMCQPPDGSQVHPALRRPNRNTCGQGVSILHSDRSNQFDDFSSPLVLGSYPEEEVLDHRGAF